MKKRRVSRKNAAAERSALALSRSRSLERTASLGQPLERAHLVHRTSLGNGLRVIIVPQAHLHTVSVGMFVKVGSRYENTRTNGISHLLEHMLFRGSARYPSAYALNRAIEELGGTLNAATHSDSTLFEATLPAANATRGVEILGELFAKPTFSDLAIEKRIVREEILEYLDEDGREVDPDNLARTLMFGSHPLGMTITGPQKNLERFGTRDLRAHLQKHYVASNMVLCVCGAVDEQAVLREAKKHLSHLKTGSPTRVRPPALKLKEPRHQHIESQGSQTDVRLSFSTFGNQDPRYLAFELLARVIDDGMSTRLHRRICEEQGLAYEVFATLEPYEECGVIDIGGAVEHHNVPVFVRSVLGLLGELADKHVSKAELEKAKRRYKWQLEATLDDSQAMCSHYGQRALLGQDGHLEALRAQVDDITQSDLRAVARDVFCREHLHVVTVGMLSRAELQRLKRAMSAIKYATRKRASSKRAA